MKIQETHSLCFNNKESFNDEKTFFDHGASKKQLKQELKYICKDLNKIQEKMYAQGKYSVLICLQGMDTAGKDSLIREVMKSFSPSGVRVRSFKVPSSEELSHNYLWRHHSALPERGVIGVWNRTHYENVLVTKVHPQYILNEKIPGIDCLKDIDQSFWQRRYEQIRNFEQYLTENGTILFKFFLNISYAEQTRRILRRIEQKEKNWKFSSSDVEERKYWDSYQKAYSDLLKQTSTKSAPWHIIPGDSKQYGRVLVAKTMLDELKKYPISEPVLDTQTTKKLLNYQTLLKKEL